MNKKEIGSALRRGVLAGTIAGSVAGFAAFAVAPANGDAKVPQIAPTSVDLPPVPPPPSLAPLPTVGSVQVTTSVTLPAFQPLPPAPAVAAGVPTTRGS
ncbi:MAG: hypothetical protein KGJ98_02405 [Chloroflexota bacterium]|nr:hypothetical protein [Chloroflexota bacterium]MDE3101068.1 hypothetical protein [Chloroflexota bacterium]